VGNSCELSRSCSDRNFANRCLSFMKPASLHLGSFATRVETARKTFLAARSGEILSAWIIFYEEKQTAYQTLVEKVPQVREISDFWRLVQNSPGKLWIPWVEKEIARVTASAKCSCGVKLTWPQRVCSKCLNIKKKAEKHNKKQKKALKRRMKAKI
jgi:hypothetical protein